MAKKRTGHFSRMGKGKYIPLHGDPTATIYFEFTVDGRRKKVCCETSKEAEAREWVSTYLGFTTHCSSYERFLDTIISMGNMAKAEAPAYTDRHDRLAQWLRSGATPKAIDTIYNIAEISGYEG